MLPILGLLSIGLVMMFSTSSIVGYANYNDAYFFIKRHFIYLFLAIAAFFVGFITPHEWYKKMLSGSFVASVILLLLTLSPLGVSIGGAKRWLNLGFLQFQPVEFVKFTTIVLLAVYLDRSKAILNNFRKGVLPIVLLLSLLLVLLILQPALGNIGLIILVTLALLFLSFVPMRHILSLCSLATLAVSLSILTHPYQMQRITGFLDPWADPLGKNYHIVQSLIAIGSGGFFGLGLGESKLKFFYLPLHYSDFIFSIICEEGGFLLASLVIVLFFLFLFRVYSTLKKCRSLYSFYLGMGAAFLICFQAFINIAVVIGLFPITGIPLTFISFGGTSLIMSLFLVGIILNIANRVVLKSHDFEVKKQHDSA